MSDDFALAQMLADSWPGNLAEYLLTSVPGMPPILQTIHLLSVCAIMASAVFVSLRILGLAVPSQELPEMVRRLQAWNWTGVAGAFVSGIWFVIARPDRYFDNPVFQIKFIVLLIAIFLTLALYRAGNRVLAIDSSSSAHRLLCRVLAVLVLLLWVTVLLAGRWIAYAEYLFW